jgi:hypothetical protein
MLAIPTMLVVFYNVNTNFMLVLLIIPAHWIYNTCHSKITSGILFLGNTYHATTTFTTTKHYIWKAIHHLPDQHLLIS